MSVYVFFLFLYFDSVNLYYTLLKLLFNYNIVVY